MFVLKLKDADENSNDVWLDSYEMDEKGVNGLYNAKSGKLIKIFVPLHNVGMLKDVGDFDRPVKYE